MSIYLLDNNLNSLNIQGMDITYWKIEDVSNMTDFAIEDGTSRSDYVVDELLTVEIEVILRNEFDGYAALKRLKDTRELLAFSHPGGVIKDLVLIELPRTGNKGIGITTTMLSLFFKQLITVTPEHGSAPIRVPEVARPEQSSTVGRGNVSTDSVGGADGYVEPATVKANSYMDKLKDRYKEGDTDAYKASRPFKPRR